MSVILVVQPDALQGKILHDVSHRIGAELVIVDSTKRAIEAIGNKVPDLILLSALLSPREEAKLMAQLRSLEGASHLQTLTLPQFQGSDVEKPRKSSFGFRKKQKPVVAAGCDPSAFGEEIVAQLARAHEIRTRPPRPMSAIPVGAPAVEPAIAQSGMAGNEREPVSVFDEFIADRIIPDPFVEAPEADVSSVVESSVFDQPTPAIEPLVAAANYEPANYDPTNYESTNYESTNDEPTNYEPTNVEQSNVEPTNSEAWKVESATSEATSFDVSNFGRTNIERASAESTSSERPIFRPPVAPPIEEDEIDKLVRQLGLDVSLIEIDEGAPPAAVPSGKVVETFDFNVDLDRASIEAEERRAADIATMQAEAEVMREAAEARAAAEREAREALAADLVRVQAEAETMREAAITEARAAAEREARETLNAELARVRSETEVTVADALNKVKVEAEGAERARLEAERMRAEAQEAFAAELARVRAEVEQKLAVQLEAARTESERMRTAEAAAVRERAAVESQLKSELERLRFVSAQARKADESVTQKATEQIKRLEAELASVRAKAEEHRIAELDELKAQMAEMREAAAQHVRDAAAEAVAAEVARASRPTAVIAQFPTREVARVADESQEDAVERLSRDYLSLWLPTPGPVAIQEPVQVEEEERQEEDEEETDEPISIGPELRRHAKWALPVAACLLLVTGTGSAISTVVRFVGPEEKPPALTVEPVNADPFIEVVDKRVGRVRVESTPTGAEAIVDGRSYGKTPITIPDLEVGAHTLTLKSRTGTIRRKINVKANETTLWSEAIFSGWLAIFSPIPVNVVIDGKPVSPTEDGRVMTSPGKHVVELINERFNYRSTETLEVQPGETTPHTASVPNGTVRVTAPDGAQVRIDGQPAHGVPGEGIQLAIGSHEISAVHPQQGERRVAVDVRQGALTEVTLRFDQ